MNAAKTGLQAAGQADNTLVDFLSGISADAVSATCALMTLFFSIYIAKQARNINDSNNLRSIYDLWQSYARFSIETKFSKKWGNVYELKFDESKFSSEDVEVIWTLMHIWQYTWVLSKSNQVVDDYLRHQAPAWMWMLKGKRDFFINFMKSNHIDIEIIDVFSAVTTTDNMNDAKLAFTKHLKLKRGKIGAVISWIKRKRT